MNFTKTLAALSVLMATPALMAVADTPQPLTPMPRTWTPEPKLIMQTPASDNWWTAFSDTTLISLLKRTEENNYSARAALRNIEIARQQVRQTKAGYYPTIGVSAGYTRGRNPDLPHPGYNQYALGATLGWELDVFGRVTAAVKAGKAGVDIAAADYAALQVSLAKEVANAYIGLRVAQNQLDVARRHVESQEQILKIVRARHDAGLVSKLDVAQAQMVVTATRATLPPLDAQISAYINTLAQLCGTYSRSMPQTLNTLAPLPDMIALPEMGVPADLLRRRPDVVEAEYTLSQLAAQVGVAKKDFLPSLSIEGAIATTAGKPGDLFTGKSFSWSVGPKLSWTVFEGMARSASLAQAKLQYEAELDTYNEIVISAVNDVQNAVAVYNSDLEAIRLTDQAAAEASDALDLALERYRRGLTDFTSVADAQTAYLQYAANAVTARGDALQQLVTLYCALGGGWNDSQLNL